MSRAKSLKLSYTKEPENCPMCGKRTVVALTEEESVLLRGGASREESKEVPRWKCATCGAVLLEKVPEE